MHESQRAQCQEPEHPEQLEQSKQLGTPQTVYLWRNLKLHEGAGAGATVGAAVDRRGQERREQERTEQER
jgi:hypothetical protein